MNNINESINTGHRRRERDEEFQGGILTQSFLRDKYDELVDSGVLSGDQEKDLNDMLSKQTTISSNENYLIEGNLSSEERKDLPDSAFGIPEERKFPLNDKEHVLLAIKMFGRCDEKYRKQLANNINKKIKEYNIYLKPGDSPFYKYYSGGKDVKESYIEEADYPESEYLEDTDIVLNFDKWDRKKNNILFITGLSGGGKSTIAKSISKIYGAELIELDDVTFVQMSKCDYEKRNRQLNHLKETCKEAAKYFGNDLDNIPYTIEGTWDNINVVAGTKSFLDWFMDNHYNDGKLYAIEGTQLYRVYAAEYLAQYPCIVKGTSLSKTMWRRSSRDFEKNYDKDGLFIAFKKFVHAFMIFADKGYMKQVPEFNSVLKTAKILTTYNYKESATVKESSIVTEKKVAKMKCKYCGEDCGVYIKGEPVYICKACGKYNGSVPFNEATSSNTQLHPVYIITSYTNTPIGNMIKNYTHDKYTHAAIAFDTTLKQMYSFNGLGNAMNNKSGLSCESIEDYIDQYNKTEVQISLIFLKEKEWKLLKERMDTYISNYQNTSYSISNIIKVITNKAVETGDSLSMICSQFVDNLLKFINIDITGKPSNLVTPGNISKVSNPKVYKIFEGYAVDYNPEVISRVVGRMIRTGKVSPIREEAIMAIFETKEFPIQFDDEGNLLIAKKENINFLEEYNKSKTLREYYIKYNNLEGMKYEAAKLWYLNIILLKLIDTKEDKKIYTDYRSKILTEFSLYMTGISKIDNRFNFASYYETTPFSSAKIKINGSTIKYTARILKDIFVH